MSYPDKICFFMDMCVLSSFLMSGLLAPDVKSKHACCYKPHWLSHPYFSPSAPTGVGLRFGLANDILMIGVPHLTKQLDITRRSKTTCCPTPHVWGYLWPIWGYEWYQKLKGCVHSILQSRFFVGYHPLYSWANLQYHTALRTASPLICKNIN